MIAVQLIEVADDINNVRSTWPDSKDAFRELTASVNKLNKNKTKIMTTNAGRSG